MVNPKLENQEIQPDYHNLDIESERDKFERWGE
jgi:hypothetical protein